MAVRCDECGNHDVTREVVSGVVVEECGLCGNLQGDPVAVQRVKDVRHAEALGVSLGLWGLLRVMDALPGLKVDQGLSTMVADRPVPPAVFFTLRANALELLDRLTRSLLLVCRRTSTLWTVEATHQGRLLFVLRPRLFHPADVLSTQESAQLENDVELLRDALERDRALDWWALPE